MNWKNRLSNYNFWISIFSAILLILQALKIKFDVAYVNEIFTAVLGLLVVIGIISDPTKTAVKSQETAKEKEETQTEKTLPTVVKNEVDNGNIQNDFKAVIETIKDELTKKVDEIKSINNTINQSIIEEYKQINQVDEDTKKEYAEIETLIKEETQPAVAEDINPYIDVIN